MAKKDISASDGGYRVLARKYRPQTFETLVGQDVLVRTLSHAIASARVAQAFILTGIRGTGKTSTARIIAKALNCHDLQGGSEGAEPCNVCESCCAIQEDRHMDVMEVDAASRTGVDDMRELMESVQFKPVMGRCKIFILDEVHMLSGSAFNALLKTLEEPPEDVKFIFATTEIKKVPATIVSRCQRFDLKRVPIDALSAHYAAVAQQEGFEVSPGALELIAEAADGSVRDGLSLLDQALVLSQERKVSTETVESMLGATGDVPMIGLLESVMAGDSSAALAQAEQLYARGAEPMTMLWELMELLHGLSRVSLESRALETMSESRRKAMEALSGRVGLGYMSTAWQILSQGLQELTHSPRPYVALEMVLIRLMLALRLPSPDELLRALDEGPSGAPAAATAAVATPATAAPAAAAPAAAAPASVARASAAVMPETLAEIAELCRQHKALILAADVHHKVRMVSLNPGHLVINLTCEDATLAGRLREKLSEWTGEPWQVEVRNEGGDSTLAEQEQADITARYKAADLDPAVQQLRTKFPQLQIVEISDENGGEHDDQRHARTG